MRNKDKRKNELVFIIGFIALIFVIQKQAQAQAVSPTTTPKKSTQTNFPLPVQVDYQVLAVNGPIIPQ